MTASRPERPSLPALKGRCPQFLSQRRANCRGGRAREIKPPTPMEDPRRLYSRLLHVLTIAIPDTGVLDEFIEEVKTLAKEHRIPKVTSKLMADVLIKKTNEVRRLEEKLVLLHRLVEGGAEE